MSALPLAKRHPCFNLEAKGSYGRVHLPVAPGCNIKCNYCDRRHDCVNESRPGVSSAVLAPHQALAYMDRVLEAEPRISVAGIAGPGDPMASAPATLEALELIHAKYPELILCLSSNGLAVPANLDGLASSGVSHVTITVNAVDPAISSQIYAWVRDGKVVYRGRDAAELMLERQDQAVRGLKERGITVKLNTIIIPGVNDHHVEEVSRWAAERGADLMNLMPLYPNKETPFGEIPEPSRELMEKLRGVSEAHIPQMRHCTRCRADAVGLLGQDRSGELAGCLSACSSLPKPAPASRPYVAVASQEGMLVNLHLGQAASLGIWAPEGDGFVMVEERTTPPAGGGEERWRDLAGMLGDCRALLVSGIGETPRRILSEAGIDPLEMQGFIAQGLTSVYGGDDLSALRARRKKACCGAGEGGGGGGAGGGSCDGDGLGCM